MIAFMHRACAAARAKFRPLSIARNNIAKNYGEAVVRAMQIVERVGDSACDAAAVYWLRLARLRHLAIIGARRSATQGIGPLLDENAGDEGSPTVHPPIDVHGALFETVGSDALHYISQPCRLTLEDLRAIVEFCDRQNLTVEIDARNAFTDPGNSIAVIYRRKK
jgi:hypothetical protein